MNKLLIWLWIFIILNATNLSFSRNQSFLGMINSYGIDSTSANEGSVQFNNEASKLIISAEIEDVDTKKQNLYIEALGLLNRAIKMDSNNYVAYKNKVSVLVKLKRRKEAIDLIDLIYKKNIQDAEIIAEKGFILEKLKNIQLAKKQFLKAINIYKNRPKININQIVSDKCNEIFLLVFFSKKDKAMEEIKNLEHIYPKQVKYIVDIGTAILIFNKENFLRDY